MRYIARLSQHAHTVLLLLKWVVGASPTASEVRGPRELMLAAC